MNERDWDTIDFAHTELWALQMPHILLLRSLVILVL